jgi:solute carrier family 41
VISSGTGIVLDMFVSRYEGFALLAIVISGMFLPASQTFILKKRFTGLPGAAGSILISRLSTSLHAAARLLHHGLPSYSNPSKFPEPSPRLTTLTLLIVTLPVEIIFLTILDILGWLNLPLLFVTFSIVFFACAVSSYMGQVIYI